MSFRDSVQDWWQAFIAAVLLAVIKNGMTCETTLAWVPIEPIPLYRPIGRSGRDELLH